MYCLIQKAYVCGQRVGEEEQALLLEWTLYCLSESPLHISLALENTPRFDFFFLFSRLVVEVEVSQALRFSPDLSNLVKIIMPPFHSDWFS